MVVWRDPYCYQYESVSRYGFLFVINNNI